MTPFEEDLKEALRRQEPAADFTARVMARCAAEQTGKRTFWSTPVWRMGLAAAAMVVMLAGGTVYERHERELKGMAAKRQLLLAMHIAGTKLQEVQQRVKESEQVEQ